MRHVQVILGRAAGPLVREAAVGHELAVRIEDRVGPEARGQDVGAGLGDLHGLGSQVEVVRQQELDRLVERQSVGGPLALFPGRQRQRPVERGRAARAAARAPRCPWRGRAWSACPGVVIDVGTRGADVPARPQEQLVPARLDPQVIAPAPGIGPSRDWFDPGAAMLAEGSCRLDVRPLAPPGTGTSSKNASEPERPRLPRARRCACSPPVRSTPSSDPDQREPPAPVRASIPVGALVTDLSARRTGRDESNLPSLPRSLRNP